VHAVAGVVLVEDNLAPLVLPGAQLLAQGLKLGGGEVLEDGDLAQEFGVVITGPLEGSWGWKNYMTGGPFFRRIKAGFRPK
tara:strand:+ start:163 stop:405 length:243 start_codon:yes stop_codon:yes gene_type:complete